MPTTPTTIDTQLDRLHTERAHLLDQLAATTKAIDALNAEYDRRGGWTRAYLVNNATGHVHRSTTCSTCHATTEFRWLTDLSGATEGEVVAAAGWRACTVCYPDAPADVLAGESSLVSDEEVASAERRARAAERRARAAKDTVVLPSGEPVKVSSGTPRTERAVRNALSMAIKDAVFFRVALDSSQPNIDGVRTEAHPSESRWLADVAVCVEALSYRTGRPAAEVLGDAIGVVVKRVRRELRRGGVVDANVDGAVAALAWPV